MSIFRKPIKKSKAQDYLESVTDVPQVSALMSKEVSDYRREKLAQEVQKGLFTDGSAKIEQDPNSLGNVVGSVGIVKNAQMLSSNNGGGGGGTVKQAPEIYSPLWLNSNINLPRDRATINAWCRSFFALNPFVRNAINLHSTYPISKLNIKCPNKKIERFFNDMIEETDLMNICVQIAQEYWLLGEAFPFAELDESKGKWSRFKIQNPDYMVVKQTVMDDEPIIMLRPDQNLKTIITSNKPSDLEQRKQINPDIVQAVKKGENIQLDNFNVSYLSNKIAPYESRGTGLPVCIFRQLMLFDQLRECYSEDTEVLTDQGFKKLSDFVITTNSLAVNSNFINGVTLDENNQVSGVVTIKDDFKVACVNPETKTLEYHKPTEFHMSQYEGEMINFKSKNYDVLVSPNHKMYVQKKTGNTWSEFYKEKAQDIDIENNTYRFMGTTSFEGKKLDTVRVLDKDVPAELYFKFLGYVISEGWLGEKTITLVQKVDSDCINDIKETMTSFANIFGKQIYSRNGVTEDYKACGFKKQPSDRWSGNLYSKELSNYFFNLLSLDGLNCTSHFKRVPAWIKELHVDHLKTLLNTMVNGDGSHIQGRQHMSYKYYTCSKQLADDVQELVFKCGYNPYLGKHKPRGLSAEYIVSWTDSNDGKTPRVVKDNRRNSKVQKTQYNGKVWCFEVPTGLFVTRRNGCVTIQGNSKYAQASNMINPLTLIKVGDGADWRPTQEQLEGYREVFTNAQYDRDFKIFTHSGVTVEKIGSGAGIYDISGDITQLIKEIYIGLQVPSVLLDGADVTYNNGGVALDALRQRYMSFRNKMSTWLKRKVFAPISKIQGFYEYNNGEKQLIVPEVDWNHMSLFDAGDYINVLKELTTTQGEEPRRASLHSLYRSLGLEFEDEVIKLRKEAIQSAISTKEKAALESMDLNSLRALDRDGEIPEPEKTDEKKEAPLPGEEPSLPGMGEPPPSLPK